MGHSQMINEPTRKDDNILDLLFTNIPDMVSDISVLGRNEACMSDHFGVQFKTNLNISYFYPPQLPFMFHKKAL